MHVTGVRANVCMEFPLKVFGSLDETKINSKTLKTANRHGVDQVGYLPFLSASQHPKSGLGGVPQPVLSFLLTLAYLYQFPGLFLITYVCTDPA